MVRALTDKVSTLTLPSCPVIPFELSPAAFAAPSSSPAAGDDADTAHSATPSLENPRRAQCSRAPAASYERSALLTLLHRRRGDEEGEGSKRNAADEEAMPPDMVRDTPEVVGG